MVGVAKKTADFISAGINLGEENPILSLDFSGIGENVYGGSISKAVLNNVIAVCRRKFKREDVVVYLDTDEDEEYNTGIVFTNESIFTWTDSAGSVEEIPYLDIESVDYNDDSVTIQYASSSCSLYLGEDATKEKYPRYMYNFIMDILELQEEN